MISNKKGWTPLHITCRYGILDLVEMILGFNPPLDSKTIDGCTPLYVACIRGVLSVVKLLLRSKKTRHNIYRWNESPLRVAVSGSNFPIVSKLLDRGFDPNFSCNVTGKTILQQAISQPCTDSISLMERTKTVGTLLEHGANAAIIDLNGNSVLHHWAFAEDSSTDKDSSTYYNRLQEYWCKSLLDALIKCGANIEAQNRHGETALYLALRRQNEPLLNALRAAGAAVKPLPTRLRSSNRSAFVNPTDSGADYRTEYPECKIEWFTIRKAGAIPRHAPLDDL